MAIITVQVFLSLTKKHHLFYCHCLVFAALYINILQLHTKDTCCSPSRATWWPAAYSEKNPWHVAALVLMVKFLLSWSPCPDSCGSPLIIRMCEWGCDVTVTTWYTYCQFTVCNSLGGILKRFAASSLWLMYVFCLFFSSFFIVWRNVLFTTVIYIFRLNMFLWKQYLKPFVFFNLRTNFNKKDSHVFIICE